MAQSSKSSFSAERGICERISLLVIDPDEGVRGALMASLLEDGHPVFDSPVPMDLSQGGPYGDIRLLITDDLPGSDGGLSWTDQVRLARPELPIILVTAHWNYHLQRQAGERQNLFLLRKPFDYPTLHGLVHKLGG